MSLVSLPKEEREYRTVATRHGTTMATIQVPISVQIYVPICRMTDRNNDLVLSGRKRMGKVDEVGDEVDKSGRGWVRPNA